MLFAMFGVQTSAGVVLEGMLFGFFSGACKSYPGHFAGLLRQLASRRIAHPAITCVAVSEYE